MCVLQARLTQKILNGYEYLVKIKSDEDRNCRLNFFAVGDEGSDKVKILKAFDKFKQPIRSTSNKISHIQLFKNTEIELFIHIESSTKYALKVYAYELQ